MARYKNNFYNYFDLECPGSSRGTDYRTPFQMDRDRVIHTYSFRRLQGKTQVFVPGEYDFYRTRLTHSIEVAQIGRSISNYLNLNSIHLNPADFYIDLDLIEAICLSHDIGHPPFGHAGERILNKLMKKYGGFEGNAQTLREIADIIYQGKTSLSGLKPSRAYIDGILKYKTPFSMLKNPDNHFIYDEQKKYIYDVFQDKSFYNKFKTPIAINNFKSLECQIMDWADDTAYSIYDILDSFQVNFLTFEKVYNWFESKDSAFKTKNKKYLDNVMKVMSWEKPTALASLKIGDFIKACSLEKVSNFMSNKTNRYKYNLVVNPFIRAEANFYQQLAFELVFITPNIKQLEYKGQLIIEKLFNSFFDNYLQRKPMKLLPTLYDNLIKAQSSKRSKARIICDYIAGMTDGYVIKIYKRLFTPDSGSILDII